MNHVQEIKIKNILEILSTINIKLTDENEMMVFNPTLKDNQIQTDAQIIDIEKKKGRLYFFNGKKTKLMIGKRITRIKFNIRFLITQTGKFNYIIN